MTTRELLLTTWHWHPSVLIGCAALAAAYAILLRGRWTPRAPVFGAGVLVLLLALVSPLHTLGERYLFSAHMAQHLLLLLIVPPLLLLGLPPAALARVLRRPTPRRIERVLGWPPLAWGIGLGAMSLWHLPALYNAALGHAPLHIVEHVCFVGSAVIFWWPVLAPPAEARLHPLAAVGYLFAAMLASGVLGIILTFAAPGLYPAYLRPPDAPDLLALLRTRWGLTPPADQQLGGLLMWVPGSLVYLVAIIAALARWYGTPDEDRVAPTPLAHDRGRTPDVA